ncbi:hypothetical protein ACQRXC_28770 (plasmid) [Niallia taxi]|uniref:hypothetical protein n=1 Tax=Niallia taxi TaxID=2499688 RepID=UPI003F60199B
MEKQQDHPVMDVVNEGVKEIKSVLEQKGLSPEEPAISALLDKHFLKMEKLLTEFTEKMEKAPLKEIPQLEMNIVGKLKRLFTDLTDGLKQVVVGTKEQVRTGIENKVNDIKIDIHNKIASKVQSVNDKIKNFTDTLDEKYSLIEKKGIPEQNLSTESGNKYLKTELKNLMNPYLETLKEKHNNLFTDVQNEFTQGNEWILTMAASRQSNDYHKLTVDLNTGEGALEYRYIDSEKPVHKSKNREIVENFNIADLQLTKELRNRRMEQTASLDKAQEPSEKDLKQNIDKQDSPAVKTVPDGIIGFQNEGDEVPSDTLIKQLKKENNGLKTFLNIVKDKHPEVYQSIYRDLKNSIQQVQKTDTPKVEVKTKEKELELQI